MDANVHSYTSLFQDVSSQIYLFGEKVVIQKSHYLFWYRRDPFFLAARDFDLFNGDRRLSDW